MEVSDLPVQILSVWAKLSIMGIHESHETRCRIPVKKRGERGGVYRPHADAVTLPTVSAGTHGGNPEPVGSTASTRI